MTYELDAALESTKFGGMDTADGGNNNGFYEIGTALTF
jgi:hypothetical protein